MSTTRGTEPSGPLAPLPPLHKKEFNLLREVVCRHCGIRLSDAKVTLVRNRVGKRLRALGLRSYADYCAYIQSEAGQRDELHHLWSVITTNETHFFREPHHLDALTTVVLPELLVARAAEKLIRVWSAGCSSGQEVYTLAAVLARFLAPHKGWSYSVAGSDVDGTVLAVAKEARYPKALAEEIPAAYRNAYFEVDDGMVRPRAELRSRVRFKHENLRGLEMRRQRVDIIFCRNVMMYFEMAFRAELLESFRGLVRRDGYLFLGTSESLHGLPRCFKGVKSGRTIFYRPVPAGEDEHGFEQVA